MQFILKAFQEIEGLGAASGVVYQHSRLYLISDYSSYLYCYDLEHGQLDKIALLTDSREFIPKPEKFDFEAIVQYGNALILLGSGSKKRRNMLLCHHLSNSAAQPVSSAATKQYDLSALYEKLRQTARLNEDELNIEGAIYHQSEWLLFQRGNGSQAQNGIFIVRDNLVKGLSLTCDVRHDDTMQADCPMASDPSIQAVEFVPLPMPVVNDVPIGFTDAILVEETIYFLATAENSGSTYQDGEVLGSYIGRMDLNTKTIQDLQQISNCHKFEGLTLYQQTPYKLEFLVYEDNDTDQLKTTLYKLTITPNE